MENQEIYSNQKNTQQKVFIGVIGPNDSGKSTIIQSLTGCMSRSYRGLVTAQNSNLVDLSMYVLCSSIQERLLKCPNTGASYPNQPAAFKKLLEDVMNDPQINNPLCVGLVAAIQPRVRRGQILMEDMYLAAIQKGYKPFAFILDGSYKPSQSIVNAQRVEDNLKKAGVKQQEIFRLNPSKFSILNAEYIRNVTHIVT